MKSIKGFAILTNHFGINIFLIISVLLLMVLNYTHSFIGNYDIGENADDKAVILLSSQSLQFGINNKREIFDRLLSQCELESSNADLCSHRYSYRANTLANYFLPGVLISLGIDTKSMNFNESLSSAIFTGLTLLLTLVFLYILFIMFQFKTHGSIFVLISFVFVSLANPNLLGIDFSIFSSVFIPSVGYGYLPNVYVPRGAVTYLLIPIMLSLVYKNNKLLLVSLLLAGLIHLGYSVIYTFIVLTIAIINFYIFKEEKKDVYMIIGMLFFFLLVLISQSIYSSESIIAISLKNLNLSDLRISLNFNAIAFYMALLLGFFFSLSKPIKKYIIIIFVINIFLEMLLFFELVGVLNSDSILQRMRGSFSYLNISMVVIVIIYILNNFKKIFLANKLSILILPALFYWTIEFNHVYMINKLSGKYLYEPVSYASYKNELSKLNMKVSKVNTDISSYINKRYANEDELYWLSNIDGIYYIDVNKISSINFEDLDIDNEFLVFLYLYIKST